MIGPTNGSWRNPRVILTLLLVFLAGAASGALSMRYYGIHSLRARPGGGPYWKEGGKEISLQRFKRELDLTPEQAQQMEGVLDDFVLYYQTLQTQMDEVRASGKERIVHILNPEQRKKFDQIMVELQARRLR
jgi:Spy/CpxP family protein refolding chaperone